METCIPCQLGLLVDFDRRSMDRYGRLGALAQMRAIQRAQHCLTGGDFGGFLTLLATEEFNPHVPIDDYGMPELSDVHRAVNAAVETYNEWDFGLQFEVGYGFFEAQFATAGESARYNPPHTCVHWIWINGELVPVYNYTLSVTHSTGDCAHPVEPRLELTAVYQIQLRGRCRLEPNE